ncbi:MAG: hypothetical protein AAF577_00230 [Pseudomonadota bacterium]
MAGHALLSTWLFGETMRLGEASRFASGSAVLLQWGLRPVEVTRILSRATANHAYRRPYLDASNRNLGNTRLTRALTVTIMPKLAANQLLWSRRRVSTTR